MKPIIKVEKLSKKYQIGEKEPYFSLRDQITNVFKVNKIKKSKTGDFWALQNINFEVLPGETVGIIGRNGAGKSTLLKILSRITPPTAGKIIMRGRVASLLEVGTGFHPELTGRENISLNGAILGMDRKEIAKKFDQIVAFAEIEKFLDTPVKRYSSGMYVRLAFAVAAHLEPDILIVDEVLAVGDVQFQKKCLGKMDEVAKKEGRTVIFVSHNMATIKNLCKRAILLDKGKIVVSGSTNLVISKYLESTNNPNNDKYFINRTDRQGSGKVKFTNFEIRRNNQPTQALVSGEAASIVVTYKSSSSEPLRNVNIGIGVDNNLGERIFALSTELTGQTFSLLPPLGKIEIRIPKLPLVGGRYSPTLFLQTNGETSDWLTQAVFFSVENGDFFNTGKIQEGQGSVLVDHTFVNR